MVWKSLPKQLGRENKKFTYQLVRETARTRDYELPIEWLARADLIRRVYRNNASSIPLSSGDDYASFKLYATDVGLLRCLAQLEAGALTEGNELYTGYKGAFAENYIEEALSPLFDVPLRYWAQTKPAYEVDFLAQFEGRIVPIEVKAGTDSKGKGLAVYREKRRDTTALRVRYSMLNLNLTDDLLNIPLFMADLTPRLFSRAIA
jgi:predicted AAA+ superfamily ATPase